MSGEFEEKRKFPRHNVYTPGVLEMFDASFPISVEELSNEGLKIRSQISVSPETYVAIRITAGRDVVFHGQIVWIIGSLDGKETYYQMGLQIDAILDMGEELTDIGEKEILIQDLIITIGGV